MFTRKKRSIEDYILTELQRGPQVTLDLIEKIKQQRAGTTKQGVYAALRLLQQEEIVLIHRGSASINVVWLERLQQYCTIAQHHYFSASGSGHFTDLHDREKIQYTFRNPVYADAFWNHAIILIMETHPTADPFIGYDPHAWFYVAHPENERALRDYTIAHGRQYLVVSASNTPLDRAIRHEFNGTSSQYHIIKTPLFPQHYYFNIIGDFLIEVWFDRTVTERMEKFYAHTTALTPATQAAFRTVVEQRSRMKLVISHNKKKAQRLKKKLLKYFYIPPSRRRHVQQHPQPRSKRRSKQ